MSHESPQEEEWSWDPVETVRHLCTNGIKVYDLQVDGKPQLLCGRCTAHNRILIDDVVKSAAEVRSAAYRGAGVALVAKRPAHLAGTPPA